MLNDLINGAVIALSFLVVLWQVPRKELLFKHIWLLDAAITAALVFILLKVSSTAVLASTAWAAVLSTAGLHLTRPFILKRRKA